MLLPFEYEKLFASNVTTAGPIVPPVATTTKPSGSGILTTEVSGFADRAYYFAFVIAFYGTRASGDNETFTARITGWRKLGDLWIPNPYAVLALTLGTATGVSGQGVTNSEYFADTMTATDIGWGNDTSIVNPADNTIAQLYFGAPAELLQVQLAKGTAASCNAIAATAFQSPDW